MISSLFTTILVRPFFNALVLLLNALPFGGLALAIVLLTVLIRFVLYPLSRRSITSQKAMQELQPEIQELKKRYEKDKEAQSRAMMELYKKRGVNPFSGCLPLLIQLPVLLALYRVFLDGFDVSRLHLLYSFVSAPGVIDGTLFGFIDLSERSAILDVITGALQFFQSRQIMNTQAVKPSASDGMPDFQQMMGKQMMYIMPLIMIGIAWTLPAALPLYWMTTTLFSIIQHRITATPVASGA